MLASSAARAIRYDSGPNMTPLVDVVMVILIFLMLTGTFSSGDWFLAAPRLGTIGPGQSPTAPADIVDVRLDPGADGCVARVGDTSIGAQDQQRLLAHLAGKRQQFEAIGARPADVQVVIKPGRGIAYDDVIRVYEAALRAGFTKVGFAPSR